MIGYNTLGTNGRLGNQMFQYASLRGIADKHGYDFCIPPEIILPTQTMLCFLHLKWKVLRQD